MATTDIYTYLHTLSRHDALPIWGVLSFAYFALHKQRKRKRLWSFRRRAAARNQKPDRAKTPVLRAALSPCALLNDSMRSEEHTSELQSLMRISYAVFCLKKKKT